MGFQNCSDGEYVSTCARVNGVYSQMPYCDWELLKFSASIPFSMRAKITSGRAGHSSKKKNVDKYLLRKAFEKYLPNELVYRDKAVCITNHDFLNGGMRPLISSAKIKGFESKLSEIITFAKANKDQFLISDYEDVVEIQNIIFLNEIQNKYCNAVQ
nr:asparagine synthase-related protein [Endozoicomonas sp. ONNA2]